MFCLPFKQLIITHKWWPKSTTQQRITRPQWVNRFIKLHPNAISWVLIRWWKYHIKSLMLNCNAINNSKEYIHECTIYMAPSKMHQQIKMHMDSQQHMHMLKIHNIMKQLIKSLALGNTLWNHGNWAKLIHGMPKPVLTYHQWGPVGFTPSEQFHKQLLWYPCLKCIWNMPTFTVTYPSGQWVNLSGAETGIFQGNIPGQSIMSIKQLVMPRLLV